MPDYDRIRDYFDLSALGIQEMVNHFGIDPIQQREQKTRKQSRIMLARKFQSEISSKLFKNKAELARHYGVSRAWITKVFNSLKEPKVS